jgi:hypothetical protein
VKGLIQPSGLSSSEIEAALRSNRALLDDGERVKA